MLHRTKIVDKEAARVRAQLHSRPQGGHLMMMFTEHLLYAKLLLTLYEVLRGP